jgi:hypothetical protein
MALYGHMNTLTAEAQKRINELIELYDPINNKTFRPIKSAISLIRKRNRKLPVTGSILRRPYKGNTIVVKILEGGFEYNGKIYKKLTTISTEITGAHWSGYDFFGL